MSVQLNTGLCAQDCPTDGIPVSYYDPCEEFKRKAGASYLVFIKCNYQFTDILDASEWKTAIANGDVVISPPGIVTEPEPTANSFKAEGCGRKITGLTKYILDYESYYADCDNKDWEWFKALYKSQATYRVLKTDCYGNVYLKDDWATLVKAGTPQVTIADSSPGHEFSVTTIPHQIEGDEELAKWVTQLEVEIDGMWCPVQIPGLYTQFK